MPHFITSNKPNLNFRTYEGVCLGIEPTFSHAYFRPKVKAQTKTPDPNAINLAIVFCLRLKVEPTTAPNNKENPLIIPKMRA